MNKEESHRPTRRSERILQLYERKKRKLEAFSPSEGNGTRRKRMRCNHPKESQGKSAMQNDRLKTSDGARKNVNHSYGTGLQDKRKCELEFSHEKRAKFGKKRQILEFSKEESDRLKRRRTVETSQKDVGYKHGEETKTDVNERKRKRKSCEFLNKVDVQIRGKRNCRENNQAGDLKNPQVKYIMKEKHSLTASNDKIVFKENENLANASFVGDESANESIQWMHIENNALDTNMEEYMHPIESETFGEDQSVVTRNVFQTQSLEEFGNNFNNSYYFLELTCNQEDINNNKQTSHQKYEPHFPCKHSCIERADTNMNETVLIIQRLDGIDITTIGHCNEPFAAIDNDIYQDQSCVHPSIKDLNIEVGYYEVNGYANRANPPTMGSYIESMDTSTSVACTKVTVKQEPIWDDYEKGTDCTEENENDSEDTDVPSSIHSELRIRPKERRKRVKAPLRIRLLKTLTMRKAWKENTTCCLKYCWIDWPTVTLGQI